MARVENFASAMLGCREAELKKAIASKPVVAIVVTQEGCGHCHDQKAALATATSGRRDVRVLEISCDDDACAKLTAKFAATPTTQVYAGGKLVKTIEGSRTSSEMRTVLSGASSSVKNGAACKVGGSAKDRLACMTKN